MNLRNKQHIKSKFLKVNNIDTDYRAEVVASDMIEGGQDADNTLILRGKSNSRNVAKDIHNISYAYLSDNFTECLCIYTTRASMYDSFPEGIFHQPSEARKGRYYENIIDEIRKHREEERAARLFFQPFELVIDQVLIDAQRYEKKFNKVNFYDNLKMIFVQYWQIFKLLDLRQAAFFIKIIPELYRIPTDFHYMGEVLSVIFDTQINVELGKIAEIPIDRNIIPKLDKMKLGVNSVLTGSTFKDGSRSIRITIGPAHPEVIHLFMANQKNNILLEELFRFILPFKYLREIKLLTTKELNKFRLSSDTHKAYLGINTTL